MICLDLIYCLISDLLQGEKNAMYYYLKLHSSFIFLWTIYILLSVVCFQFISWWLNSTTCKYNLFDPPHFNFSSWWHVLQCYTLVNIEPSWDLHFLFHFQWKRKPIIFVYSTLSYRSSKPLIPLPKEAFHSPCSKARARRRENEIAKSYLTKCEAWLNKYEESPL